MLGERLRLRRRRSGQSWNPGLDRRSQDAMVRPHGLNHSQTSHDRERK